MNRQHLFRQLAAFIVAALAVPLAARADVVNITDSQDAMIFGKVPVGITNPTPSQYVDTGNASGKSPAMFAGADGSSNIKRSLIQFDLSSIPAGSTITSATLTLHVAQIAGSGGGSSSNITTDRLFGLYDNLQSWTEGPAGATTGPGVGGTGQGSAAQNGDATWNDASFNTNPSLATPWANGTGGNFSSTESDQLDVALGHTPSVNDALTFQSSSGLVADLQNWLDDPSSNDGWMLKSDNLELTATSFIGFWTRDALGEGNTTAVAPFVTVTFTPPTGAVPEPASLGLIALAAPAMLVRRRHRSRSTKV